ncbi:MAG: lipoyl(octanoyl) transferase LipB [Dehalococcoidia bacterium]
MNDLRDVRCLAAAGVDYESARAWQYATAAAVRAARDGGSAEAVAMIEHAPVYTMGARGGRATLRMPQEALPAPLVDTDRGGDITWHGPGQLVVYPILDLRRRGMGAAEYIGALEGMLLDTLGAFGIAGELVEGRRGVWIGNEKIAAMGIRVQGGVSMHGIALNVAPDLAWFDAIVPCGIEDGGVTSMARAGVRDVAFEDVRAAMRAAFARRFQAMLVDVSPAEARAALGAGSGQPGNREAVHA